MASQQCVRAFCEDTTQSRFILLWKLVASQYLNPFSLVSLSLASMRDPQAALQLLSNFC